MTVQVYLYIWKIELVRLVFIVTRNFRFSILSYVTLFPYFIPARCQILRTQKVTVKSSNQYIYIYIYIIMSPSIFDEVVLYILSTDKTCSEWASLQPQWPNPTLIRLSSLNLKDRNEVFSSELFFITRTYIQYHIKSADEYHRSHISNLNYITLHAVMLCGKTKSAYTQKKISDLITSLWSGFIRLLWRQISTRKTPLILSHSTCSMPQDSTTGAIFNIASTHMSEQNG